MEARPLVDTPLYNSRIINPFILLIKQKYSYVNISELLSYAGMKEYEVADQAHWFKQDQVERFYERLVQLTGNPDIAREAGRYAASPDVLGAMRQYILGLVDAASTFEIINKTTANFTKSASYESRRISSNTVEIVVTPLEEGLEKQFQCENRIGFFEAIVLIFNHKITDLQYFPDSIRHLPTIQHPECVFRGGKVCRYIITWEKTVYGFLKKIRTALALFLAIFNLTLMLAGEWRFAAVSLPASVCAFLLLGFAVERSEKLALKMSLNSTKDSIDNLLEQINLNYNNAMLSNEIGQKLGSYSSVEEMLPDVAKVMEHRLQYDRGVILLVNPQKHRLEVRAEYGYRENELSCLNSMPFPLDQNGTGDVYTESFKEQRHFLVNDLRQAQESLGPRRLACAQTTGTHSFICCPIISEGVSLGVLSVENVKAKKPLVERDISLIMGIASMIGISIRNCELIGALKEANEELEHRVATRTSDLEQSRRKLELQHEELERTYFELEEETAQRLHALEELSEKERMLLQQSRLAALGEMISNIAHQWRQPLNELGLIVQELPMMYDKGELSREYLRGSVAKFMKVLAHTSKTIDDFRNFFKPDKEKVPFRVREVLAQTLSLVKESFKNLQITIRVEGDDDMVLHGHPNEFSQVILNILFNSRDAFLDRNVKGERGIVIEAHREGRAGVITISDNAGGIPEAIIGKIFDPYFTTRGPEKGTGIGLYMSKIIIEKNIPGHLSVRNTGEGAQFRIEVPL
jgi:two-component system, NtrC family, C4-dicarboxylate transport sensor histidine kinase DctB